MQQQRNESFSHLFFIHTYIYIHISCHGTHIIRSTSKRSFEKRAEQTELTTLICCKITTTIHSSWRVQMSWRGLYNFTRRKFLWCASRREKKFSFRLTNVKNVLWNVLSCFVLLINWKSFFNQFVNLSWKCSLPRCHSKLIKRKQKLIIIIFTEIWKYPEETPYYEIDSHPPVFNKFIVDPSKKYTV